MSSLHKTLNTILISALLLSILACATNATMSKQEETDYNFFNSQNSLSYEQIQQGPPKNPEVELCTWAQALWPQRQPLEQGKLSAQYISRDFSEKVWPNLQAALDRDIDAALSAKNPYRALMIAQAVYNPHCIPYQRPAGRGPLDRRNDTLLAMNSDIEPWHKATMAKIQASRQLSTEAQTAEAKGFYALAGCLYTKLNDKAASQRNLSNIKSSKQEPQLALSVLDDKVGFVEYTRKNKDLKIKFEDSAPDKLTVKFIESSYEPVYDNKYTLEGSSEYRLSDDVRKVYPFQILNFLLSERKYEKFMKNFGGDERKCVAAEPKCAEVIKAYKIETRKLNEEISGVLRTSYTEPSEHIGSRLFFHYVYTRATVTLTRGDKVISTQDYFEHALSMVGEEGSSQNQAISRLKRRFADSFEELLQKLAPNRKAAKLGAHDMDFADATLAAVIQNPSTPDAEFYLRAFCGFDQEIPKL